MAHFKPIQIIAAGFFLLILTGAVILSLPISSSQGTFTPFVDAFFTAVTSVCVTGLTTVTVAEHYNLFGKIIILFLIQLGGLGVVSSGIGVLAILKRRIGMRERILIQNAYSLDSMDGLVRIVFRVLKGTFIIESTGAILYALVFIQDYDVITALGYSIFHAVSAFCNAGIDVLGDSSFVLYQQNILVNLTTAFLVIMGGIGFIVWWDCESVMKNAFQIRKWKGQLFQRLTTHSKLAITTTAVLLIGGTILIFAFEYTNPKTLGQMDLLHKIVAAFFESVTTRTAGFAAIPQENFRDTSYLIILMLMFIGGSPMGTAGGMKTTTIAMLFLSARTEIKGYRDTMCFRRKIATENIRTGFAIVLAGMAFVGSAVFSLLIIEEMPLKEIMFECVSAVSTSGLGRGNTSNFSTMGKLILCMLMYAGRLGPMTFVMTFDRKKKQQKNTLEHATGKIMLF